MSITQFDRLASAGLFIPKGKPLSASDWKSSASLNTSINGINIGENCPRANVNDAMRSIMADLVNEGAAFIGTAYGNTVAAIFDDAEYLAISQVPVNLRASLRDGTIATDLTTNINAAFTAAAAAGFKTVRISRGTWTHSSLLKPPAGMTVEFERGASLKSLAAMPVDATVPGSAHQGQSIWLRTGSSLINPTFDANGFGAGVVVSGDTDVLIENLRGKGSATVTAQMVNLLNASRVRVIGGYTDKARFGVQAWACTDVTVSGVFYNRTEAAFYAVGSTRFLATGNIITNCEDVGPDIEGGVDCLIADNIIAGCKNGELAMFADGSGTGVGNKRCTYRGNRIRQTATYIKRDGTVEAVDAAYGAITLHSLSAGSERIEFIGNSITVEAGAGRLWNLNVLGTGVQDLLFADNHFTFNGTTRPFEVSDRCLGFRERNNSYVFNAALADSGVIKNIKGGEIVRNDYRCTVAPTVPVVLLYTDIAAQKTARFAFNTFTGCGDNAVKVDQFISADLSYVFEGNSLSDGGSANGGLTVTANGVPKYVNQSLKLAELNAAAGSVTRDFDALTQFGANVSFRPYFTGTHSVFIGGTQRNLYRIAYMTGKVSSLDGTGASTGIGASATDYCAFATSVMTITKVAGTNSSCTDMMLNTSFS